MYNTFVKTLVLLAFFSSVLNPAFSQSDPNLDYGDLHLQGKVSISVEDCLGNRDSLVLGLGRAGTTRNVDLFIPLEVNIFDSAFANPDIRVIHSTNQLRNGALEYFLPNYNFTYRENAHLKFDVRSPYPNEPDWLIQTYQPYNFKISGTNFPLVVKSKNFNFNYFYYQFYCLALDSNNRYYSHSGVINDISRSLGEWHVVDTINNAAELSNYNLGGTFKSLFDPVNEKINNGISAYCTPDRILHITNLNSVEGSICIYSSIGQEISNYPISNQNQTIVLPNQTSIVFIKTPTTTWKSFY